MQGAELRLCDRFGPVDDPRLDPLPLCVSPTPLEGPPPPHPPPPLPPFPAPPVPSSAMSVSYCLVAAELTSDLSRTVSHRRHFYMFGLPTETGQREVRENHWGVDGGVGVMRRNEMRRDAARRRRDVCLVKVKAAPWNSSAPHRAARLLVISKGRIPPPPPPTPTSFPSCSEIFSFALLLLRVIINKAQHALVSVFHLAPLHVLSKRCCLSLS